MAPTITRREWLIAGAVATGVMALTLIPYLVAVAAQTEAWRFSGFLLGVDDGNSYIAKMGQGARGAWLFRLPYTSEPQTGAFVYLFYLLLGKLSGPTHTAQVVVYHAARVVFGVGMLLASYRFLAEAIAAPRYRWLGLVWVALGGGLGWVLAPTGLAAQWGSLPVEFFSPEAFSYLTLFTLPHLAAARMLFLLAMVAHLRGRPVWAGAALFGVALIQPLYVLVAWAVLGGLALVTGRGRWAPTLAALRPVVVIGLISAPVVAYTVLAFSLDPLLSQWNSQNRLPSAHPLHYLAAYGVLLAPAVLGWRELRTRHPGLARLMAVWAVLAPFLLYAPLSTQRRLIEGFQVPLVAAALVGLTGPLARWGRALLPAALTLTLPSTLMLWLGALGAAQQQALPIFLPADQVRVFAWLSANAQPEAVGLGAVLTGNALPAHTPLTAFIGHGPETVRAEAKVAQAAAFFAGQMSAAERRSWLAAGRITYVLIGPEERALGPFDPAQAPELEYAFGVGGYFVYRVVSDQ